jgi:hypothetical protein
MITQDRLKELLFYDEITGKFYWKIKPKNQVNIGDIAGTNNDGYVSIILDGISYRAHRLAWFYKYKRWPIGELDHIDRIRDNNSLNNLREVTCSQNAFNQIVRINNKLKIFGVYKRGNKYRSQIQVNGKKIMIGTFDTAKEASIAYQSYKQKLHII